MPADYREEQRRLARSAIAAFLTSLATDPEDPMKLIAREPTNEMLATWPHGVSECYRLREFLRAAWDAAQDAAKTGEVK